MKPTNRVKDLADYTDKWSDLDLSIIQGGEPAPKRRRRLNSRKLAQQIVAKPKSGMNNAAGTKNNESLKLYHQPNHAIWHKIMRTEMKSEKGRTFRVRDFGKIVLTTLALVMILTLSAGIIYIFQWQNLETLNIKLLFKPVFVEMGKRAQEDKDYFKDNRELLDRIAVYMVENADHLGTKPIVYSSYTLDLDQVPDKSIRLDIIKLLQQGKITKIILGADQTDRVRFVMSYSVGYVMKELRYVKNKDELSNKRSIEENKHHLIRRYEKLDDNWGSYVYALQDASDYRLAAWNLLEKDGTQKYITTGWPKAAVILDLIPNAIERDKHDRELVVCVMFVWKSQRGIWPFHIYLDAESLEFVGMPALL